MPLTPSAFPSAVVKWNPANLDRAILSAFRPSLNAAKSDADATNPKPSMARSRLSGVFATTIQDARGYLSVAGKLGAVFELGAEPHTIAPRGRRSAASRGFRYTPGQVGVTSTVEVTGRRKAGAPRRLFIQGGPGPSQFVSGTVQHPGAAAKPYVAPAAYRWAQGGFQAFARRSLAAKGFR